MKIIYKIILILIFIYSCNYEKINNQTKKLKISKVFIPKYEICDLDFYNVLDSFIIFASQNPKFNNSIFSSFEIDNKNNEFYFEVI